MNPAYAGMTLEQAQQYCRDLAHSHYENFEVASRLLPPERRDEYLALYAFARGADDLADETGTSLPPEERKAARLSALEGWRSLLSDLYTGRVPAHPAFIALRPVVEQHDIPKELFERMIEAFERDQTVSRYERWSDVLEYTHGSANPVGRWVLRLYGLNDPGLDSLSDAICTGLQLVNFIQDVRSDLLDRDRVYLPQVDLERFGVLEEQLAEVPTPPPVRRLLAWEAKRAERLLAEGRPLIYQVDKVLRGHLILFHGGGRLALHALRRVEYDVGSQHVRVDPVARFALLLRALRGRPL